MASELKETRDSVDASTSVSLPFEKSEPVKTSSLKNLKRLLSQLEKTAKKFSEKVLEIEDSKEEILKEISEKYKVKNPEKIYEDALVDYLESADECLDARNFFKLKDGVLSPDEEMTFLYSLWGGEYYTNFSGVLALENYHDSLSKKIEGGSFVEFCEEYSK